MREACLAARLLHQPSMQPPLQSNQELLLDVQGPSGYASCLHMLLPQRRVLMCNQSVYPVLAKQRQLIAPE